MFTSRLARLTRSLCLLTWLAVCLGWAPWANAQGTAPGRRVALLIGNSQYQHERALRNPVNDAELLGRVLRDELKFDAVRVERNLNLTRMDKVLEQFASEASGAATVVFYFSGHGLTSAGDRRSYLLPVDARTGAPDSLPLKRQAVAAHEVRDALERAGARVTLLLLDACRDGPGDGKSGSKGLARVGGGNGLLVAYATEEGQVAADGSGANSPYALALAEAWRQPGQPILAQLDTVYDRVTERVPGQRPTREGNLRADAYLVSPFGRAPTQAQAEAVENEAWALCRAGSNAVPCDAYLATWPQGRFASLARTKLRELQTNSLRPEVPPGAVQEVARVSQVLKDCDVCPEMVVIPSGRFLMGSSVGESGRRADESPQRLVEVRRFELGKYEVTRRQWKAVMGNSGGCDFSVCEDDGPVTGISWNDVQEFIRRLNKMTGRQFRLPSEAEWEYSARSGTTTAFSTGATISTSQANFNRKLMPPRVGKFPPNAFGLHDMHGNVWEMVQDCYGKYSLAPVDGSAKETPHCDGRVDRGGAYFNDSPDVRSARRGYSRPGDASNTTGFRVARTL